jgi:hypothetical protein
VIRCAYQWFDKYTRPQQARKYCRIVSNACGCTLRFPLLCGVTCRSTTVTAVVHTEVMDHHGWPDVGARCQTESQHTQTARKYCRTVPNACGATLGSPLLCGVTRRSTTILQCAIALCITVGAQVWAQHVPIVHTESGMAAKWFWLHSYNNQTVPCTSTTSHKGMLG